MGKKIIGVIAFAAIAAAGWNSSKTKMRFNSLTWHWKMSRL